MMSSGLQFQLDNICIFHSYFLIPSFNFCADIHAYSMATVETYKPQPQRISPGGKVKATPPFINSETKRNLLKSLNLNIPFPFIELQGNILKTFSTMVCIQYRFDLISLS